MHKASTFAEIIQESLPNAKVSSKAGNSIVAAQICEIKRNLKYLRKKQTSKSSKVIDRGGN